jgi:adenosylmethionine-8-amino-7-oxononanoate aminotransferase
MANALGCAAANASLDLFETEPRLDQAVALSTQLAAGLEPCRDLPGVKDVRVLGAIGVVELHAITNPAALRMALVEQGVWIRPFRNILYLTPALTIGEEELATLCGAIRKVLKK